MRALTINAAELLRVPGTRRQVRTAVPLAALAIDDPRVDGDVDVDVTLESTIDDVLVTGTLAVAWSDECRRCLAPLADTLRVEVDERYAPAGTDIADAFPFEHGQIDLAPMVREEVLLGVPDAPLCGPDCAGLCPVCGVDLREGPCGCERDERDDRWSVLDQLREPGE
jgi:uncharacterized protein